MQTAHPLTSLFDPTSVAVIGASEAPDSAGRVIFSNMLAAGFRGQLYAVNPRHQSVQGQPCVASVADIGRRVDLAIIAAPARRLQAIIDQCGEQGVRNAVIVSSIDAEDESLQRRLLDSARAARLRLLGPGSLGMLRPALGLCAALTQVPVQRGDIALISQSGAMCSVVLDWAAANGVGFSTVVSLGATLDIDFGETLDYLIHDPQTRHILLYVDHVGNARQLMSALRSAARVKPIILLKAGRHAPGGDGTADAVFDAAMRRAGVVRVQHIEQLFFAAKALSAGFRPRPQPLAIVTNGGGPGMMAVDRAGDLGTPLAELSADTRSRLDRLCGRRLRGHNPLDLGGDASAQRYHDALLALADDPAVGNLLLILSPHAMTDPLEIARRVIELAPQLSTTLCCCWMGGGQVAEARGLLEQADLPVFSTPEAAIEFLHNISRFFHSQQLLLQAAGQTSLAGPGRASSARMLIEALLNQRRTRLSAMEAKSLLRRFELPTTQAMIAHDATEALFIAEQIGFPVAMRVEAPELPAAASASSVRLNLNSTEAVWNAFQDICEGVRLRHPEAQIAGVSIHAYRRSPDGRDLIVRVFRDPVFGPVIQLAAPGQGSGQAPALALPPLNPMLARDLIDSAPFIPPLLQDAPGLELAALERVLVAVSDMVCELPWIRELELDPLLLSPDGATVADARITLDQGLPAGSDRYAHMAIHPYPAHLVQDWQLADRRNVRIRPIRPEDAEILHAFFHTLSPQTRYYRFMQEIDDMPASLIARFTQIDYDREMALVATIMQDGRDTMIGSARYALAPDGESVEFALVIGDDWQRCGLGRRLLGALIDCARDKGHKAIVGDVLGDNAKMLQMMRALGFRILPHPEENTLKRVVKPLRQHP